MRYWHRSDGPQWPNPDQSQEVPCQHERASVPREVSEEAWKEYARQGHGDQSHERLIQRGGFGSNELAIFLYQRCKRLEASLELACIGSQASGEVKP